jgi:two-component system chemotaxis sensor kinase CheA
MSIDMSQFYQIFFEEAAEHLAAMETLLLGIDLQSPDPDQLNAIFRAAHSIKGGAGTFGFSDMTEVTHVLETLLDKVRKGELALRNDMVDAFLRAGDVLRSQLDFHRDGTPVDEAAVTDTCAVLAHLSQAPNAADSTPASDTLPTAANGATHCYQLAFAKIAKNKLDPLVEELGRHGHLKVTDEVPDATVAFRFDTELAEEELWGIIEFVANRKQVSITPIAPAPTDDEAFGFFDAAPGAPASGPAPEVAVEDDGFGLFISEEQLKSQVEEAQGFGFFEGAPGMEPAPAPAPVPPAGPRTSVAQEPGATTHRAPTPAQAEASSIRVSVEKVDQLINLVGELVITQAMLAQASAHADPVMYEGMLNSVAQLERNTRDLQEAVMSIRMLPISFVFSRFPRVVRDVAGKLGKQVELRTVGEGTELDKGLIEKIADPLTHLVRNSLDHGIEAPETRVAAGKPARGTLTLRASHQGGNIVIEVSDDGGGLHRERILNKARERGLAVSESMSDQDVWQLIFAPGFSTAEVVTDVSGRGVGMDVVKRNIEGMGGRVELSSVPGQGTTVTIRLPLTLAILDGMSVAVRDEIFIVPLGYIVESLQPTAGDVKTVAGRGRVVTVRGEYLPVVALHEMLNIVPRTLAPHEGILVVIESDGGKAALFVDELVGQHQVVIKSLETNYRKVPGISAATIMGDGRVALILDVAALVRMARPLEPAAAAA